jgi:hypothetical protein
MHRNDAATRAILRTLLASLASATDFSDVNVAAGIAQEELDQEELAQS